MHQNTLRALWCGSTFLTPFATTWKTSAVSHCAPHGTAEIGDFSPAALYLAPVPHTRAQPIFLPHPFTSLPRLLSCLFIPRGTERSLPTVSTSRELNRFSSIQAESLLADPLVPLQRRLQVQLTKSQFQAQEMEVQPNRLKPLASSEPAIPQLGEEQGAPGVLQSQRERKGSFLSRNNCVCSAFSNIIARRMGLWGTIDHTLQVSSFRRGGNSPVFLTVCQKFSN